MKANEIREWDTTKINVEIVRTFIKLREFLNSQKELTKQFIEMREFMLKNSNKTNREFQKIWNTIKRLSKSSNKENKRKIGFDLDQ